jgi:hypothetical protein
VQNESLTSVVDNVQAACKMNKEDGIPSDRRVKDTKRKSVKVGGALEAVPVRVLKPSEMKRTMHS